LTLVAFFFLSSWISGQAQNHWGKRDDPRIVIDEIMGYLITMFWLPKTTLFIILGFFLFRFFDIFKPPPIRLLEKVKGGYGVVLDDVLAGVYSNIILQIISYFALSPQVRGVG
jgi:phosphatidylglycerophosphatase A